MFENKLWSPSPMLSLALVFTSAFPPIATLRIPVLFNSSAW